MRGNCREPRGRERFLHAERRHRIDERASVADQQKLRSGVQIGAIQRRIARPHVLERRAVKQPPELGRPGELRVDRRFQAPAGRPVAATRDRSSRRRAAWSPRSAPTTPSPRRSSRRACASHLPRPSSLTSARRRRARAFRAQVRRAGTVYRRRPHGRSNRARNGTRRYAGRRLFRVRTRHVPADRRLVARPARGHPCRRPRRRPARFRGAPGRRRDDGPDNRWRVRAGRIARRGDRPTPTRPCCQWTGRSRRPPRRRAHRSRPSACACWAEAIRRVHAIEAARCRASASVAPGRQQPRDGRPGRTTTDDNRVEGFGVRHSDRAASLP